MTIERAIPPELFSRLGKDLFLSGGTIRVAPGHDGAGSIVRHLVFPESQQATDQLLEQIKTQVFNNQSAVNGVSTHLQGVQFLQQATVAMQGMNLAVSVAGFALVMRQLNKISQQLKQINANIDQLQLTADEIQAYQQLVQTSRYHANLESLQSGLLRVDKPMISGSMVNLREVQYLFQHVCNCQLDNLPSLYKDSVLFQHHFKLAFGSAVSIANAHAHLGEYPEAERVITNMSQWQAEVKTRLFSPIKNTIPPFWLGKLSENEKIQVKATTTLQKILPENLHYIKNTYQLCQMTNVNLMKLRMQEPEQLLVVDV